jgi:diaminopimelate decarboxylase
MKLERVTSVLAAAARENIPGGGTPSALFYDLDVFRDAIGRIRAAFSATALHTVAVKANPLAGLLREACRAGMGAECASLPELHQALRAGFPPAAIVFDSPAKTPDELRFAVEQGIYLNADNLQEVARLAVLAGGVGKPVRAGLRINPQTGAGGYAGTSTATATSKFGVPLGDERDAILDAYDRHPWLGGLHVHTGSQVCPPDLVVRGVAALVALTQEIERRTGRPLEVLDIGGGLPADYGSDEPDVRLDDYAARLRRDVPDLARYRLVTEFGRAVSAKAGWAASRVEYTKQAGGRRIAVIHLGADFLVRTAYVPEVWTHRVTVHAPDGAPRAGPAAPQDIAGPLCFSGDLVAAQRPLPLAAPGDLVVIHDTGAYTLSMWSRYNSRQAPPVYAYEDGAGGRPALRLLKPAETVDDVLRFWGE